MDKVAIFWFRRDLRLEDNAGLYAALSSGFPVVPVFIFDSDILSGLEDKDDKRVSFIYAALLQLQEQLLKHGSTLDVRYGKPDDVVVQILSAYAVSAVYTNQDYEPYATARDQRIGALLAGFGVALHTFKDQVIFEKNEVAKDDGSGYKVYTPYAKKWHAALQAHYPEPYPSETLLQMFFKQPARPVPSLPEMGFTFNRGITAVSSVDEAIIQHYHQTRNLPAVMGTSRLGVHLRFGTISIRAVLAKAIQLNRVFLGELIWREFFMQILWQQPRVVQEAFRPEYNGIDWRNNEAEFERWCDGETGFAIVDAGMRELNQTGFMHNRVRMIVGSFLVKDLLIDWRWGEAYFARKLMDFELASNNGNWQWVAGCGCDAAPYFRVFNPDTQAKKFDPQGEYIRRWVPEIDTLQYIAPIVDHAAAKERCIKAYKAALQAGRNLA